MTDLLTAIGEVFTAMVSKIGDLTTELITNEIFQIILGVAFLGIILGVVMAILSKVKGGKRRRR